MRATTVKWVIGVGWFAWVAILLAHQLDLTTADLGRHITNGSMILRSAADRDGVLHTNFYSYTMASYPFINHHWLTGVVFYLIWKFFGFAGLSVWNVLLGLFALGLFFDVARRTGGFWLAAAIAIAVTPLITLRSDIRPETITSFLTGLFFWTLWQWRAGNIGRRRVYGLPVVMLLWVNLHIGFVFGFLVLGSFLLDASTRRASQRDQLKQLAVVSGLCVVAGLINPHFLRGFLYPLSIFNEYGYRIFENQSIPFLRALGLEGSQPFLLFEITAGAVALSIILAARRGIRKVDLALALPVVATGVMAYLAVRHFGTFGLFAVPALTGMVSVAAGPSSVKKKASSRNSVVMFLAAVAVAAALIQQVQGFPQVRPTIGLGLLPGVDRSADFFKQNNIAGPIFNDYDVGGYLIFKLSMDGPNHRVFVDNRPEAYPVDFFRDVYISAQKDDAAWHRLDGQYHFNAIFFSYRDFTSWAKLFLVDRAKDSAWALVYADTYNVIFLRRDNPANAEIIRNNHYNVQISGQ